MTAININRRRFMQIGSLGVGAKLMEPTGAEAKPTPNSSQSEVNVDQNVVRMTGDGLGLTPIDTASLWTRLATEKGIERDNYSIGGTVAELESYFAKILGKERAVFFPTGTLANHLAVRALSNGTGRTIVQAESHLFNDSGDCVQNLSGITLMPLAPGRATFRLDEVRDVVQRTASGRVARPGCFCRAPIQAKTWPTTLVPSTPCTSPFTNTSTLRPERFLQERTHSSKTCTMHDACLVQDSPVHGRLRRLPITTLRISLSVFSEPRLYPSHSSIASTTTKAFPWILLSMERTSFDYASRTLTWQASEGDSAHAVSFWGRYGVAIEVSCSASMKLGIICLALNCTIFLLTP